MKKFVIQVFLLLLVIGGGVFFFSPTQPTKKVDLPFMPEKTTQSSLQINNTTIMIEIADTATKRSKGLGGRTSLGENEGMLFIFEKVDKHTFWMKGLSFPLDFVWIKEGKVVDITEDVPAPKQGQTDSELPFYSPKEAADKVLELNAGSIKKFNIKVGDTIKLNN